MLLRAAQATTVGQRIYTRVFWGCWYVCRQMWLIHFGGLSETETRSRQGSLKKMSEEIEKQAVRRKDILFKATELVTYVRTSPVTDSESSGSLVTQSCTIESLCIQVPELSRLLLKRVVLSAKDGASVNLKLDPKASNPSQRGVCWW